MFRETTQNKSPGLKLDLYKGEKIQQRGKVDRKQYTKNCHKTPKIASLEGTANNSVYYYAYTGNCRYSWFCITKILLR